MFAFFIQAEDGIRDKLVTGVQTCALSFQAEDGIRDKLVTGVQTCALLIQAEDGIRDKLVTGVQTCALPILDARRLRALAPGAATVVVPNGTDPDYFQPNGAESVAGRVVLDRKSVV